MVQPSASDWYAQQLGLLMRRHSLTPLEIERRTTGDGHPSPVSQVSIRRILKGAARTEPERVTLERIARCAGEPFALAFPAPVSDGAEMFSAFVSTSEKKGTIAAGSSSDDDQLSLIAAQQETRGRTALLVVDTRASDEDIKRAVVALQQVAQSWLRRRRKS